MVTVFILRPNNKTAEHLIFLCKLKSCLSLNYNHEDYVLLCLALVTKLITHLSDLGAIMQSTFLELSDISTSMLTLSDYLILTTPNFSENSEPWNIKLTETLPYLRETSNLTPDLRPSYRVSPGQFNSFIFILRKNKCPNKLFKILDVTSRSLFGIEKEVNLHNNLATNAIIMS